LRDPLKHQNPSGDIPCSLSSVAFQFIWKLLRRWVRSAPEELPIRIRTTSFRACGIGQGSVASFWELGWAGFAQFFFDTRKQAGDWRGTGVREVQRAVDGDCSEGLLSFDAPECTWCPQAPEF